MKILVPTDFTEAGEKALEQALALAQHAKGSVDVLHIVNDSDNEDFAKNKVELKAKQLSEHGIDCKGMIMSGPILDTINQTAEDGKYDLMVVGTHGAHGLRQHLFGADILRLIRNNSCPTIVVQEGSVIRNDWKKILLPVGSHVTYHRLVQCVAKIAALLESEVVIFRIDRNEEMPQSMIENIQQAKQTLTDAGVNHTEAAVETSVYSFGYAKQTLLYATENKFDLIAIMPDSSAEHSYFANADKERVLTNESGIPVICAPGVA